MIVKRFYLGNTEILVDDTYYPKDEEENQQRYEEFNKIGIEILMLKSNTMNQTNP